MEQYYKNIMVAVDGSKASVHAFQRALQMAKKDGAKLLIVHVIDTKSFTTFEAYTPYDVSISDAENYGEALLKDLKEEAKQANHDNVETILESGSPKRDLPRRIAQELNIDLIVCGATGLNAVERFIMGSVSEQIVRSAHCDVLIVKDDEKSN